MADINEQIQGIEKEIRETPYNKSTEHHIGRLRAKLSRLKDKEEVAGTKKGGGGRGYAIKKQGHATAILIGPPSAGKSTLINQLTNAESKVAPYAFTTVSVIPGMLKYNDAYIQILDVPGLIEGAESGKGRGKEVLSVARGADLLIIMSDIKRPQALQRISIELEKAGIRINKTPPEIIIDKKGGGGIIIHSNIRQEISRETIKEIAQEFSIRNAEITIKKRYGMDEFIDAFSGNRVYIPAIYVLNKVDTEPKAEKDDNILYISAEKQISIDRLKNEIWKSLKLLRIYLVKPDEEPSLNNPMIVKKGNTLKAVAQIIGSDFAADVQKAKIWGVGSKFPGQEVSLSTPIQEGMQVRFI